MAIFSEAGSIFSEAYLPLLADDRNCIQKFHITEQTLQEHIGHANQVMILLGFIERVTSFPIDSLCLNGRRGGGKASRKQNINLNNTI